MSKPTNIDELLVKYPLLSEVKDAKTSLGQALKGIYKAKDVSDMGTYAELIEEIPFSLDTAFESYVLSCQDELLGIIDANAVLIQDDTLTYGKESYKDSIIFYAPAKTCETSMEGCFQNSTLMYLEPLTATSTTNLRKLIYGTSLTSVDITLRNGSVSVGAFAFNCKLLEEITFHGSSGTYLTDSGYNSLLQSCPKMSKINNFYLPPTASHGWMFKGVSDDTAVQVEITYQGTCYLNLVTSPTTFANVRNAYLPPLTTTASMFDLIDHLGDLTDSANQYYISRIGTTYSGYYYEPVIYLTSKNKAVLEDDGRYDEFVDALNAKGWFIQK